MKFRINIAQLLIIPALLLPACDSLDTRHGSGGLQSATPPPPVPKGMDSTSGYLSFPDKGLGQEQKAANWCWAAAISATVHALVPARQLNPSDPTSLNTDDIKTALIEILQGPMPQERVVSDIFGGRLPDIGANISMIVGAMNGKTFLRPFPRGGQAIEYTLRARYINGLPSAEELYAINDGDHAVIVVVPHHCVVLTSARWERRTPDGSYDDKFQYRARFTDFDIFDPWPRRGRRKVKMSEVIDSGNPYHFDGMVVVSITERMR